MSRSMRTLLLSLFGDAAVNGGEETFAGKGSVLELGTGVLDGHGDAGGEVAQGDFGGGLVDVLATRTFNVVIASIFQAS